jgi:type IV secretion system protein VirD4
MDFEAGRPKAHYKHRLLMMLTSFQPASWKSYKSHWPRRQLRHQVLSHLPGHQPAQEPGSRLRHDETITPNCHVQTFPPNRVETAEHLSRLTGQTTVVKEQITTSGRRTA